MFSSCPTVNKLLSLYLLGEGAKINDSERAAEKKVFLKFMKLIVMAPGS